VWTAFVAVFLAIVAAIVLQIALVIAMLLVAVSQGQDVQDFIRQLPTRMTSPAGFMALILCGQLPFLLSALIPGWLSPTRFRERLGLVVAQPSWTVYPLTMLGSLVPLAIGLGLAELLARILPPDPSARMLMENMTLEAAVPFVLLIALFPGIGEELLFRGYMQRRLLQRWDPAWAIGVTTVIFALAHVAPHTVLAVLPIGLWLGVVAWKSGSIFPGMLCHAFINGSLNSWRLVVKFAEVPPWLQMIVEAVCLLIGVVAFAVACLSFLGGRAKSTGH
jgi:membrane protease YdiL (CAAX protease family)